MDSPQLENGHFRIANEIAEALAQINLSSYQSRLLWAVLRKTYGFNKKDDWISNSQLVESTGLRKQHISRAKRELFDRNILVTNRGNKIAFNKLHKSWKELPKGVTSHKVTNRGSGVTNRGEHKRQYTKDNIQKTGGREVIPPSLDEVVAYCEERNNGIDAEEFMAHYEANGWMRGKSKIKSWKACVITWEKKRENKDPRARKPNESWSDWQLRLAKTDNQK